jgi:sensor domain CHASE-containing protein
LLAYWKVKKPDWNEEIFEIFRNIVEGVESGNKYSEYQQLRREVIDDAEAIRDQLESKVSGVI